LRYVANNIDKLKRPDNLEYLPSSLKNALLERRLKLYGLHDDKQLKILLNKYTLNLNLSKSTITDITLENITLHCRNLRYIKLTGGEFKFTTQQLLATFPLLRCLQEIYLQNSDQMTDEVVECIGTNCSYLIVLDVGNNSKLTDKCIDFITDLKLTHLNLCSSQITDAALIKLSTSECGKHLVDLNISYCKITSNGLASMNLNRIECIGLRGYDIEGG
jgi:hypothetical protein